MNLKTIKRYTYEAIIYFTMPHCLRGILHESCDFCANKFFHSSQELSGKCAVQMRCRSGSLLACYQRYLYGTRQWRLESSDKGSGTENKPQFAHRLVLPDAGQSDKNSGHLLFPTYRGGKNIQFRSGIGILRVRSFQV